jgi:predicted enzyme related to lactoylglutathione lyase
MGSPVVHWELMSKDPAKVSDFYAKIFDWKIQHVPEMNYRIVETGGEGGINGGILKPEREGPWPGMGSFSLFTDPEGRMMGLWKAAKQR